jgi:hypothetical protein
MNRPRHAIVSTLATALLIGCSSKTDVLANELELALGNSIRSEYSVESIQDQVAIGSHTLKAKILLTAVGHRQALAAIPAGARNLTATGFEYSTHRKDGSGARYFIIHISEHERSAYVQVGEQ